MNRTDQQIINTEKAHDADVMTIHFIIESHDSIATNGVIQATDVSRAHICRVQINKQ